MAIGRLTAAKEDGASIEIGGKKVALGIPGAKAPTTTGVPDKAFSQIPLARPGTADEAAAGMLLCVCFIFARRLEVTYVWTLGGASLASPLASYVTGHTLEVTGGR
jgi:3-oxoacyl-[acyl-carrier protein] reductase